MTSSHENNSSDPGTSQNRLGERNTQHRKQPRVRRRQAFYRMMNKDR
jgi:hypothetical protein